MDADRRRRLAGSETREIMNEVGVSLERQRQYSIVVTVVRVMETMLPKYSGSRTRWIREAGHWVGFDL